MCDFAIDGLYVVALCGIFGVLLLDQPKQPEATEEPPFLQELRQFNAQQKPKTMWD